MNDPLSHSSIATGAIRKTKVRVYTPTFEVEGWLHVANVGKDTRQLTQLLQKKEGFLALTDVQIWDRLLAQRDAVEAPFIQVNLDRIEFVQPLP
ncbi:MAG: hypothetical protein SFZ03_08250 [Candidatus Melainabacteria bacterium]|nr:hypothetical protein [Candidatus Melainabacteria bacterium]